MSARNIYYYQCAYAFIDKLWIWGETLKMGKLQTEKKRMQKMEKVKIVGFKSL